MPVIAVGLVLGELVPEMAPPASWVAGAVVFVAGLVVHESHARYEQNAEALGRVLVLGSDTEELGRDHRAQSVLGAFAQSLEGPEAG